MLRWVRFAVMNPAAVRSTPWWHRLFAVLGVALVLALGVFGADADLHERLHDHEHGCHHHDAAGEDSAPCAVVLFAAGVTVPLEVPAFVPAPFVRVVATLTASRSSGAPMVVDVRQPPGRGPPSA